MREDGESVLETIMELWAHSNKTRQQVNTAELRQFTRTEAGESQWSAESRKVEAAYVPLYKNAEDAFRVLARASGGAITSKDLAAVTNINAKDSFTMACFTML